MITWGSHKDSIQLLRSVVVDVRLNTRIAHSDFYWFSPTVTHGVTQKDLPDSSTPEICIRASRINSQIFSEDLLCAKGGAGNEEEWDLFPKGNVVSFRDHPRIHAQNEGRVAVTQETIQLEPSTSNAMQVPINLTQVWGENVVRGFCIQPP